LIDGLDRVEDETALFHLLNFARESDASVLLTRAGRRAATRCACQISCHVYVVRRWLRSVRRTMG